MVVRTVSHLSPFNSVFFVWHDTYQCDEWMESCIPCNYYCIIIILLYPLTDVTVRPPIWPSQALTCLASCGRCRADHTEDEVSVLALISTNGNVHHLTSSHLVNHRRRITLCSHVPNLRMMAFTAFCGWWRDQPDEEPKMTSKSNYTKTILANVNSSSCSLYVIGRPSVCRLSVVCNVGAPYSGDWNFRHCF